MPSTHLPRPTPPEPKPKETVVSNPNGTPSKPKN